MSAVSEYRLTSQDNGSLLKFVVSAGAAVLGGWGFFVLYRHLSLQHLTHQQHAKKRSLEADKNIMRIMKKTAETGSFLGGNVIEG
jgi:hypothetical protein